MITFQNGYNADNINSQKTVVSFGGYIPQEVVRSDASGTFARVSGFLNRFENTINFRFMVLIKKS